jgi:predicted nucleic acid-binding protein
MYGLLKYSKPLNEIAQLPVLDYTKIDAELSSELELKAERKGKKPLRTDAMIAAITINNNGRLYTNNTKHFKDFENLELF